LIALSVVVFLVAVVEALRRPRDAGPDPWEGNSLEWWADSPPGHHNFRTLPPVRSERPVFDARVAAREAERAAAAEAGLTGTPEVRP
ncbi:MAG TPA: hypothetical protein VFL03_16230, partial [Candidatus Limnocylindrales bacterium]|nr:hypothetical protein [Candidatus Limnocylindrales bacterium]